MHWTKKELNRDEVIAMYDKAMQTVRGNVRQLELFDRPVLTVCQQYPGIWMEHNHDWMFFAEHDPQLAIASHDLFYQFQAPDGLFPAYIFKGEGHEAYSVGYGQVQTVYPLAASALYVAKLTGDEAFLRRSYEACKRFDDWLCRYRDTRGTGLFEFFCEYDTGCDNSARVTGFGIPHSCPNGNARVCVESEVLPVIAPDLSANKYCARMSLSEMAKLLGKEAEAAEWFEKAQQTKKAIYDICYDPEDEFFYDVDKTGAFRKYRTEHIIRMFMCGVIDKPEFERIYERYITDPAWFGTPYPFPSVAVSDPGYNGETLFNNWGGMSQSHTALETNYWMRQYGKDEDYEAIASIWLERFLNGGTTFTQEVHPITGQMSSSGANFTPSCLAFMKFAEALGYIER